jgi:uncharacterized metal-binding protein
MKIKSRKIGLISCSGEDLPEGTVSRVATRRVLEDRDDVVTICLPLFLAGGQEERDFAKENPCVTVDGCEKRCAAVGVKKYGGVDAKSSIVISDIVKERKLSKPLSRSKILSQDEKLVREVMSTINHEIKEVQEGKD